MATHRSRSCATNSDNALKLIRDAFAHKPFLYVSLSEAVIVHEISTGQGERVWVIGQPSEASYEWVACTGGAAGYGWDRSNCGYGCPASALRDGLTFALGGE